MPDLQNSKIDTQTQLLERAEKIGRMGHWCVDLTKNTLFWSKEIYRIHGVTPEQYEPEVESAINFYHKDDVPMVREGLNRAIENKEDFTFEARIIRPNGETRYVRTSGECGTDESGNTVSVFGIFLDITEQKIAYKKLEENNEFLKLIMNTIPDLFFIKDKDFKLVEANDAFLSLYPPEQRDKIIGYTTFEQYDEHEKKPLLGTGQNCF